MTSLSPEPDDSDRDTAENADVSAIEISQADPNAPYPNQNQSDRRGVLVSSE